MLFGSTPFSVNAFAAGGEVRSIPTGVEATGSTNAVVVVGIANLSLTGVEATGAVNSVVVDAQAVVAANSVDATVSVGDTTVVAKAVVEPQGVDSTGNIGTTTVIAEANVGISAPVLTITAGSPTIIAEALVISVGVAANTALGNITTRTVNRIEVQSVPLSIYTKRPVVTTAQFDYESLKDSYDRDRVVYVSAIDQRYTITVPADPTNRTVHIQPMDIDRTVRIAA